jgi:uncharacterized repeat protein (TIGR03803 family)
MNLEVPMIRSNFLSHICALVLLSAATAIYSHAQTFTNLASFDITNGTHPIGPLAQGLDGNLYGTTNDVGASLAFGRVFKVTPEGTLTTVFHFSGFGEGYAPQSGLVLAPNGNFYGTTYWGGNTSACQGGCGTVFEVTPTGTLTSLHSFDRTDGINVAAGLVQGANGNFHGATIYGGGGAANCFQGCGTIFEITPTGTLTTLYLFQGTDGKYPEATLVEGSDGNLYGTTYNGGSNNNGTVFKITPTGTLTTLYSFASLKHDGAWPLGLVQGTDGNFYGITQRGGAQDFGTIFKITSGGTFTMLHSFAGSDGVAPLGALVQATDGNFYGTTQLGGSNSCLGSGFGNACGTVYEMTPEGVLTTLHNFDGTDGELPETGLVQATDGNLYGTTAGQGGSDCASSCGTIFKWSTGLAPFVTPLPATGHDGNTVRILGTDLTGATLVMFNGKEAKFTIVSSTEIKATVPMCVKTGLIEVTTPGGKLTSNVVFTAN